MILFKRNIFDFVLDSGNHVLLVLFVTIVLTEIANFQYKFYVSLHFVKARSHSELDWGIFESEILLCDVRGLGLSWCEGVSLH